MTSACSKEEPAPVVDPAEALRELVLELSQSSQPFVGTRAVETVLAELERARSKPEPAAQVLQKELGVAEVLLGHGRVDEAVALLEDALARAVESGRPASVLGLLRTRLASAHLRRGVVDNELAHHVAASSIFPVAADGVWSVPAGAVAAIPLLEAALEDDPADLGARWLLNVAHMEKGTYPADVPRRLRVPVRAAGPDGLPPPDVPRFVDKAAEIGGDAPRNLGGVVVDDLDGNGTLDFVISSMSPEQGLTYLHGNGHGAFEDWSERSHLADQKAVVDLCQADFDNNGLLDLFLVRGAWLGEGHGELRNSLLRQENDLTFTDVTVKVGMLASNRTTCASWADFGLDGQLDLYVGNEGEPCELYQNSWGLKFGDVAQTVGVLNGGATRGVAWGDFDNDGDPDLFVSNWGSQNPFYLNELRGRFSNIGATLGVNLGPQRPARAAPELGAGARPRDPTGATWFFDYDGDGWLDLFVAGYDASLTAFAASYLGLPSDGEPIRLYRNNKRGGLREVAAEIGLARVLPTLCGSAVDLDNDGYLDLVLGTGRPGFEYLVPNVALQNRGGRGFVDATPETGLGQLQPCGGIAFGDLDNDGDQDAVLTAGGFYPSQVYPHAVLENQGVGGHWITLILRGASANYLAFGARVRVDVEEAEGERSIHRVVGSGAGHAGPSAQLEIGLGAATRIVRVVVRWPVRRQEEVFEDLPLDTYVKLTEGKPGFQLVRRWKLVLGSKGSD